MTEPHDRYVKELSRKSGYRANWLPSAPLHLGDVGVIDHLVFQRQTTLDQLGIGVRERRGNPFDVSLTSGSDVSIHTELDVGGTGATIEFSRQGAFVFQAGGCVETQIEDLDALAGALAARRDLESRWNPAWCLVDTVVRAAGSTIAVAESERARLDLQLDSAAYPTTTAPLVPDGRLHLLAQSGQVFHLIAARALTPLYRVRRLKRSFLDWLRGRRSELARAAPPSDVRADEVFDVFEPGSEP